MTKKRITITDVHRDDACYYRKHQVIGVSGVLFRSDTFRDEQGNAWSNGFFRPFKKYPQKLTPQEEYYFYGIQYKPYKKEK